MSGRPSAATEKALALIGKPKPGGGKYTAYAAARECEIALSTIYRALLRRPVNVADILAPKTRKERARAASLRTLESRYRRKPG